MANVLVSDFDGTITRRDFFQVFLERFAPPEAGRFWEDYLAGRLTHFEALRSIFGSVAPGEAALIEAASATGLDSDLRDEVASLAESGWGVVVASAGCDWYIRRLLDGAGVDLELHANPGRVEGGRLRMELPQESPYFSREAGIDKAAIVRAAGREGGEVAFAGDGRPDLAAALLVPVRLRFARATLAEALTALDEPFRPFERWAEVAWALKS